jgi:biotin carboxylase
MAKRILILGAAQGQLPAIRYGREQGHDVITCDYLPSNPGHRLANESHNVSTTDVDGVLDLARKRGVDAVIAYASDPAASTAAYVCNALGLPSNPYEPVRLLTRKDLFRRFLVDNGFNAPRWVTFRSSAEAFSGVAAWSLPVVVKPVDSSGSKGVTIVRDTSAIVAAAEAALAYSRQKAIVVEEYIETADPTYQLEAEGFLRDGRIAFICFGQGHFDLSCNPVVPVGPSFPSFYEEAVQRRAHADIQRVFSLLGMERGAFNVDMRVDHAGRVFILEIGPRNGGNRLLQLLKEATGVDLTEYIFRSALGQDCSDLHMVPARGWRAAHMLHACTDGVFDALRLSAHIQTKLRSQEIWVEHGTPVRRFDGADRALGYLMLEFSSQEEMADDLRNIGRHVTVALQ